MCRANSGFTYYWVCIYGTYHLYVEIYKRNVVRTRVAILSLAVVGPGSGHSWDSLYHTVGPQRLSGSTRRPSYVRVPSQCIGLLVYSNVVMYPYAGVRTAAAPPTLSGLLHGER